MLLDDYRTSVIKLYWFGNHTITKCLFAKTARYSTKDAFAEVSRHFQVQKPCRTRLLDRGITSITNYSVTETYVYLIRRPIAEVYHQDNPLLSN